MAMFDKKLVDDTKKWWDRERPENQFLRYINSRDRSLTDASIRRFMYESDKEDEYGEGYTAYFSAENFHRNMRAYFTKIAKLYMREPKGTDDISSIIESIPSTAEWITLIINDMDALTDKPDILSELMNCIVHFASKCANIILIGNGGYREIFCNAPDVLEQVEKFVSASVEDNIIMLGTYDQDTDFETQDECFESDTEQNTALNFYWKIIFDQLKYGYFDYTAFRELFTDTVAYLIPDVTKDHVRRNVLDLICNIKKFGELKSGSIDGCEIWEFDAARKFAAGFYRSLVNSDGYNDDFSAGEIAVYVTIENREIRGNGFVISGSSRSTIPFDPATCSDEMNDLADTIRIVTYEGEEMELS